MILLDQGDGYIVPVRARVRDRIRARLRADRTDLELARGAAPDATLERALRARKLTSSRSRRDLAAGIWRVLSEVGRPTGTSQARLPLNARSVADARTELRELGRRLLADGPVAVTGVAQTRVLLTDARGPLTDRGRPEDLGLVVRRAIDALSVANGGLA